MKIYSPLFVALRIVLYGSLLFGMAQGIFFDAAHPMEEGYFGELTFTEIGQEVILFILFVFYLFLGSKWKEIRLMSTLVSLFFLMAFIREFNFLIDHWIYPVLVVLAIMIYLLLRNFKKIKQSCIQFFSIPASQWFIAGLLVTLVFSRLMGRSKFWRLLYSDESYRLAKAATEEGLELLGDTLMLISAFEFLFYYLMVRKKAEQ
ncbi:hypothetical protein [Maribellus sp. YY47]|uniref:hypothetical protein n=1 Tax=Maribellus sp. YY47 TaxID=2929486 RepID=UPI00200071BE|nr:hypothetical protein [Maribellus sp. YY47]MCK3685456.1 hypothetical protein [Maribellus sp. YY47]